jgi:hypothetical protein
MTNFKDNLIGVLGLAVLLGGLFGIGMLFHFINDNPSRSGPVECYTDWDGRTNPTICR